MSFDLFSSSEALERLPMQDAEVYFMRSLELPESQSAVMQKLIEETEWKSETITLWGKQFVQPRLVAWFGDENAKYSYSGAKFYPSPWTHTLLMLKSKIESVCDHKFNSVLVNYYRNNLDSMGMHSDDEPELGDQPVIASLSLGQERTFVFKHKTKGLAPVRIKLTSGSLLLMKGKTQNFWKHGINKESKQSGGRLNLTFRKVKVIQ